MNHTNTSNQAYIIMILRMILDQISRKEFCRSSKQMKDILTALYVSQNSAQIFWHLQKLRESLKYSDQQLPNKHLYLFFVSVIINHGDTEDDYKKAALNCKANISLINLIFAIFLFDKGTYKKGQKYCCKLKTETAFEEEENMSNIHKILIVKVDFAINLQLLQSKFEEVYKTQFINQILHFKQCFLYRCTQIKQLSQDSYSQLSLILFYSNRYEDSLTLAYKLRIINDPATQHPQSILAVVFHALGKYEECIECAKQVIVFNPQNSSIYPSLIVSLTQVNQYLQAKKYALKFMSIKKYNHYACQTLGTLLLMQGKRQLGIQFFRSAAVIHPSEKTYALLALTYFHNGQLVQAERCYLKSIRIKRMEDSFSQLGQLYWSVGANINGIHCFIQAVQQNYTDLNSFYYLGICAKKDKLYLSIINRLFSQIKIKNEGNIIFKVNLSIFHLISNHSQSQFFDFVSKFLQQKKKGEQTIYSDIATKLIQGYSSLINFKLKYLDVIFVGVIGYLGRIKEKYYQAHLIYAALMNKYKPNKNGSLFDAFTKIYQTQISKTPKEVQAVILQFIIAEMVNQDTKQAIECYFKSLSYAQGDYDQFHLQFYKRLDKDIQFVPQINLILQNIIDSQLFLENYIQIPDQSLLLQLRKCIFFLNQIKQQIRQIKNFSNLKQAERIVKIIRNNKLFKFGIQDMQMECGLDWGTRQLKKEYFSIDKQIKDEEQTFKLNLHSLSLIYSKASQNAQLLRAVSLLVQPYLYNFVLNQKIKIIFNYFYTYILGEGCHKQFAYTLSKLKNSSEYNFESLREDLQNIFKEANKYQKKEWEPQRVGDNSSVVSSVSEIQSIINYPLIEVNSQTRSQMDQIDKQFQSFIFYEPDQVRSSASRKKSESDISSLDGEDQRQFMKNNYRQESVIKKARVNTKKSQLSSSKSSEQQLQDNLSQSEIDKSNESDAESDQSGEGKWFQLQYFPSNIQFQKKNLYQRFNGFLHQNTFFLIKYLSKQKVRHIAKHKCNETKIDSSQSFKAKVEHGDQMHLSQQVRGGIQERTLKWIWLMGPIHIFRWITDIALGIEELEDLGIYHADLFFRNTIRVTKGNKFSFKIIDFDKAFKITQTQKRDKSFKRTEDMFDFWLRFNFEGNPRQPAYRLDIQSVSSQKTRNAYNERDILEYIFGQNKPMIEQLVAIKRQSIFLTERLSKCLKLLSQHMQTSHLEQYSALVLNLLFPKNEQEQKFVGEFINEQKIFEIIEELERLKEGNISYTDFAEKVRMIGGLQKDKDEDEEYEK